MCRHGAAVVRSWDYVEHENILDVGRGVAFFSTGKNKTKEKEKRQNKGIYD